MNSCIHPALVNVNRTTVCLLCVQAVFRNGTFDNIVNMLNNLMSNVIAQKSVHHPSDRKDTF